MLKMKAMSVTVGIPTTTAAMMTQRIVAVAVPPTRIAETMMKDAKIRMLVRNENELPNCESFRKRNNVRKKRRKRRLGERAADVEGPIRAVGVKIQRVAVVQMDTDRSTSMVACVIVHGAVVVEVCITVWSLDETTIQDQDKTPLVLSTDAEKTVLTTWARAKIVSVREEEVATTAPLEEADHSTTVQLDTTIVEEEDCRGLVVSKEPTPTMVLPVAAAVEGSAPREVVLSMTVAAVVSDGPSLTVI
jgi:hypothetical protein